MSFAQEGWIAKKDDAAKLGRFTTSLDPSGAFVAAASKRAPAVSKGGQKNKGKAKAKASSARPRAERAERGSLSEDLAHSDLDRLLGG